MLHQTHVHCVCTFFLLTKYCCIIHQFPATWQNYNWHLSYCLFANGTQKPPKQFVFSEVDICTPKLRQRNISASQGAFHCKLASVAWSRSDAENIILQRNGNNSGSQKIKLLYKDEWFSISSSSNSHILINDILLYLWMYCHCNV